MLLNLGGRALAPAKLALNELGLESKVLTSGATTIFEIQEELSIYRPQFLLEVLSNFGEVQMSPSKTPLLDKISKEHRVEVRGAKGNAVVFQNWSDQAVWISGPCSIDSEENLRITAELFQNLGLKLLRGGAKKPRTSPHEFQGVGRDGYRLLANVAHEYGLLAVSEALSEDDVEEAFEYLDIVQVGARNMQNFSLLKKLGKGRKAILLKRGPGSSLREWALAAEHLLAEGNDKIILCERGVRGLERELRYTLDLAGASFMQHRYGLPVVIDPSHATGVKALLPACAKGALAMGFSGLMLETHPRPVEAKSDALQALSLEQFEDLYRSMAGKNAWKQSAAVQVSGTNSTH